jgi:hypothetical protein
VSTSHQEIPRPGMSGRHVVFGMFGFALLMVGSLWLYWEMYTRPYRDLQNAIAAEFPGSSPRAVGGRHRSHESGSPLILRIIVWVNEDPNADEAASIEVAERLAALAREHHDVMQYDLLEIVLVQRVPEEESPRWTLTRPIDEWFANTPNGTQ